MNKLLNNKQTNKQHIMNNKIYGKVLDELKKMQDTPNNYLENYFFELKREVDLEFSLIEKEEDKEKWLEIIDKIKSIEMHYYDQIKPLTTYNDEIQSIKREIKESIELNTNESTKQKLNYLKSINFFEKLEKTIDEIKFKIEKDIFSTKLFYL